MKSYLSVWGRMVTSTEIPVERRFSGDGGIIYYSHVSYRMRIVVSTPDDKIAVMTMLHELSHGDLFIRMSTIQKNLLLFHIDVYHDTLNFDLVPPRSLRVIQGFEAAAWRKALELKSKYGLNSKKFSKDLNICIRRDLATYADERGYSAEELVAMVHR